MTRLPISFRALIGLFLLMSGCSVLVPSPGSSSSSRFIRPVVAVSDFENKAGFSGKWNLGDGMAEVMINELLESGEVVVLERKHLQNVVGELTLQKARDLFRREGRVQPGRLKNARYLIRGVVSDFHVSGDKSGWFASGRGSFWGRGSSAKVTLNTYLTEVETGQIIASTETTGKASRFGFGGEARYQDVAFGGEAYFKTPLGKATKKAMATAARILLKELPDSEWQGRVASGGPDLVIINGGENVRMELGERLLIRGQGREITDPVTGDVIQRVPGPVIGKLRVESVKPLSSEAVLLEGRAERGDIVERLQ